MDCIICWLPEWKEYIWPLKGCASLVMNSNRNFELCVFQLVLVFLLFAIPCVSVSLTKQKLQETDILTHGATSDYYLVFVQKYLYKASKINVHKVRDDPNINMTEYMSSDTSAYLCGLPRPWPVRLCRSGSGWRGCHRRVCVSYAPLCCRHCHCSHPSLLVMGLGGWSLSQEHSHLIGRKILGHLQEEHYAV